MEKERGIPVQMLNDREKVNRPNSQVGFIEFVICPMAESITNIFPQVGGKKHGKTFTKPVFLLIFGPGRVGESVWMVGDPDLR
ncbi:unnamed protein product [Durusdinium trenchii]|uniref:PDEase domain-containing protein n=1 Tax=Durusdinium trenchii TaxID=1381693 RepID=A0ABP0LMM3_9DINO